MVVILGLLTLTLWVDTEARIRAEQNKIAGLNLNVVQDLLANIQDRKILQDKLNSSGLFSDWAIVDGDFNIIASSAPISKRDILKNDPDLKLAKQRNTPVIVKGSKISAWLTLPKGEIVGVKMDIHHLIIGEFNPWESVRIILLIMPLGTILLILIIFFLLTRLVIKPIETLSNASGQIATGNYDVQINKVAGTDEVANLINTFKVMLDEIKEYRDNMETKIEEAKTKIKATEEQLIIAQRLSATGTLAAGIAHEINNPLGGIINATSALKKGTLSKEKADEYIDLITDGLNRIQGTLKKILQFFPRKLTPQPIDLKPVVERAILLVQYRMESNNINIETDVPYNLPMIFGEANELQQVFLNILMNAIDGIMEIRKQKPDSERGNIKIKHEVNQSTITIEIKDDGIGMNEVELRQAFDLFYTTKDPGKGTGLGLPVTHSIIDNHNGKITLGSKRGQGVTIRVTLPIMKETIKSIFQ
jgi:signal transduction histidine kinase